MKWHIDQKVKALRDVFIYTPQGRIIKHTIKKNNIYIVEDYISSCCMTMLDVGEKNENEDIDIVYECVKCKKLHVFKPNKKLFYNEIYFEPLDESGANEQEKQKDISDLGNGNQSDAIIYIGRPIRVKKNTIVPEEQLI